jgi:hypothetical protein
MPITMLFDLPKGSGSAAANDNGQDLTEARRPVPRGGFWAAVRRASREGARLDYLAPGVLRIAGAA